MMCTRAGGTFHKPQQMLVLVLELLRFCSWVCVLQQRIWSDLITIAAVVIRRPSQQCEFTTHFRTIGPAGILLIVF